MRESDECPMCAEVETAQNAWECQSPEAKGCTKFVNQCSRSEHVLTFYGSRHVC
jgi:hypothetical protein